MALPIVGSDQQNILKYNAKSAKWKVDDTLLNEVTMVVDMDNLQVGWLKFAENTPPGFELIEARSLENGGVFPTQPQDLDSQGRPIWRKGFKVSVKLADKIGSGKVSVREWSGNSLAANSAVSRLHDAWLVARARHPGYLPVVHSGSSEVVPSKNGDNFIPILTIERWVPRPTDLKGNGLPAAVPVAVDPFADLVDDADGDLAGDIPFDSK